MEEREMATALSLKIAGTNPRAGTAKLGAAPLIAFSAVAMPIAAAQIPLNVYLPAVFAQHYGVPLAVLGMIFLIEKIWGALADPIIGVLSDRTRSRFGRRRSWIAAGGLVFGLSGLLLFFPPMRVTPVYLGLVLFSFYLGWSMIQIPYFAWSGELSGDYDERTRIATYQTVTGSTALLLVLVLPTVIDQLRPSDGAVKLGAMGALLLAMLVPSLLLTLWAVPEAPARSSSVARLSFAQAFRLVLGNTLLMRVLGSDFAVTLGQSIRGALFVFFVSIYMDLPRWASGLFLLQFVFGIAAGPIWMKIGYRLGKHRAAIAGELVQVAINLGLLLVVPGQLPLLLGLTIAQGLAQGSGNLMLRAMVADIADKHRLETGEDRTALFFSVFSISIKAAMAAAVGIALPLVAWLGFDPKVTVNTPEALRGLLLVFALGPAIAHIVSAVLVSGFSLDAKAHADIHRQLAERERERDLIMQAAE
jgi:GPH family glycoside/pentoside/hexuronide:cation symporter